MTGFIKKLISLSIAATLLGGANSVIGQPIKPEIDFKHDYLADQRKLFSTAWYAAKQGHISLSQKIAPKIKDYPLYPDLEAEWLSYRPREERFSEALAFIKNYQNTTAANKVSKTWQNKAIVNQKWHWYEQIADVNDLPTASLCQYTLSLLNSTHRKEEGRAFAKKLWLSSDSQPKQCDPVFNQLTKQGFIDEELVWQRAALAMMHGKKALAEYLMKKLNGSYKTFAQQVFTFKFGRDETIGDDVITNPKAKTILKEMFILLARVDPHEAAERYLNLVANNAISDSDDVRREIAKRIFLTNRIDTQQWLEKLNPVHLDDDITDWQLRFAISNEDWSVIADILTNVVNEHGFESLSERERYWQARANQELGEFTQAQMQFKSLAVERSFYGFMSADISDLPYQLNHQPISVDNTELENIVQHNSIKRIREWLLMGEDGRADIEWRLAQKLLTQREKLAVAKFAQLIEQPNLAIRASIFNLDSHWTTAKPSKRPPKV
jgi:soluble lytic murein transglycosylase